ncbi:MAG: hypothetical protein IPO98_00865 [Saprospiraceae bacterium]|nr:hypothetical protein [Saprospiraceae bacterium]
MKFPFSIFILFIISSYWTNAQILNPVKWNFEIRKVSGDEYKIIYTAKLTKDGQCIPSTLQMMARYRLL